MHIIFCLFVRGFRCCCSCLGLGFVFFGGVYILCVCAYVHEEAAFSGGRVLPLGSIYTLFSNTYKFTNFSNEEVDSEPSPVWQYCVLPAKKRGFYLKLNAKT